VADHRVRSPQAANNLPEDRVYRALGRCFDVDEDGVISGLTADEAKRIIAGGSFRAIGRAKPPKAAPEPPPPEPAPAPEPAPEPEPEPAPEPEPEPEPAPEAKAPEAPKRRRRKKPPAKP
jgi:hypothetical protein